MRNTDSKPNSIEQPKLFHFLNENSIQLNGDSTLKELAEMNSQERGKHPVLDLLLTSFPEDLKLKTALELLKLIEGLKNDPGISKEDMEKIINPAPQYSSIQDALEGLANKETVPGALSLPDTLHRLNVHIEKGPEGGDNNNDPEEKYCYFFTDGTIKLRHEGDDKLMPSKIFLHNRQEDVKLPKVLVYCTGSGTGKTVELVGSSASRGMDLGIIFTVQDNTPANEVQDKNERNAASMMLLKEKMKEVLKRNPKLKTFIDLATDERPLKINIGLDEAFECPKLVRSIIAERQLAWETVVEALVDDTKDVKDNQTARIIVSFSVAGKGAHIGVVGSNSQNFETVKPSA